MQALIDFEGWRKWRGFAGAQPMTTARGLASPMQVGDGNSNQPEPPSPLGFGKAVNAKTEGIPEGANGHAHPNRPTDTLAHEISSGSGGSADTLDSTTNPTSTTAIS